MVIYGPELGRRALLGRTKFEVGRSSKCELRIDQESVSRHHARISYAQGTHYIEDLGSTNGTIVAEERISGRHPLKDGDHIKIGRSILKYMTGSETDKNYHEEIYRLMTVDALTQTYNKRYFNEALEREHNRSSRYNRDLSLIVLELDDVEKVHDAHGHVAGDAVLRQIALGIKGKLRAQDIFARIGSEQFAVLLPEVALMGARATAEKIRAIAQATLVVHNGKVIPSTVSLGVAMLGNGIETADALVKAAEGRLDEAKRAGRNCVVG